MTNPIKNRYNQITPTAIQPNECSISTPLYFSPTADQSKELLNNFREVVRDERLKNGWSDGPVVSTNGVAVQTAQKAPMTSIEEELGMTEETLRYALFQRSGIPERLFLKLCQLTDTEIVSRDEIRATYEAWLDHLLGTDEDKGTKPTTKTRKTRTKKPALTASA